MEIENIEQLLKSIGSAEVPDDVHEATEKTFESFGKTLVQTREQKHHILGDHIMKSKIRKFAAAAVIVIAILAGLPFFGPNGSGVVLADVLERIEQAQAFMYRMKMTMTGAMMPGMPAGKKEMEGTVTMSNDYGMKMDWTVTDANCGQEKMTQQMYVLPDQKVMITVMPEKKQYMRMEFDDDLLARMKKQNNDPREMIKQIMSCEYIELGRSVIDGIEVEGFQTTDPAWAGGTGEMESVKVTLWVDVETWLPVRAEMDFKMNEQMQVSGVIYDYQWDVQADAIDFEPVIPDDFKPMATGMQMPKMNEEGLIEGLKLFAELSGSYPKKLSMMELAQEIAPLANSQCLRDRVKRLKEEMTEAGELDKDEFMIRSMQITQPLQSPGLFYMTLVQDKKDPAYYGESVGPDDADAVLLRWKVSDDEYRVIYGDLTAQNVTAEQLAQLESPPSQ